MKQNTRIPSKSYLLLIVVSFLCLSTKGQSISGKVTEQNGKGLPFVNVLLLNSKDSALVKAAVTDTAGTYSIDKVHPGDYLLSASMVGYKKSYLPDIRVAESALTIIAPVFILSSETTQLREVTVTGQRPFVEQQIDRTIVNVANSIVASGSTALEVLEKAPGVTVDRQNDQVQLRGKDGVIIQINGKQTYLASQEVVALLRSTASDNIDKIELITNPSAKYDAAGNSGIINIVMKKNNNLGTNGMVSLAGGTGRYKRERASIQLNHRNQHVNVFGNYAFNHNGSYFDMNMTREFIDGEQYTFGTQNTFLRTPDLSHNAKAGLEYSLSNKTSIGLLWTGFWNNRDEDGTAGSIFASQEGAVFLEARTVKTTSSGLSNQIANVNFQHKFGTNNGQLTADVDMGKFDRSFSNYLITSTSVSEEPMPSVTGLLNEMPSSISIYTLKSDYSLTVSKSWKMETGIKFSSVRTVNDLTISTGNEGNLQPDPTLGNYFKFNERITAGYINASGRLSERTEIQAGIRVEHTRSTAHAIPSERVVNRDYINFFPSLFISKSLSKKQTITFSYSRRIDRPNYQNLNPGRSYADPYFYTEGNPFLVPQYTHSLEIKHGINTGVFTSLGASYTDEYMTFFVQPVDSLRSQRTLVNTDHSQVYNATLSFPVTPVKGWTLQVSLIGIYARFQYSYLETAQKSEQLTARLTLSNSIILGKGWSAEFSGWLNAPAVNALHRSPWLGSADAGLQKSIGSKLKAKLTFQDVFHTNGVRSKIDAAGFVRRSRIDFDTRVVMLNLTFNFGNQKLKGINQRKTGSEDELKRTN